MPSTVIRTYAYNAERRELSVVFQTSRSYTYLDVPPEVHADMKASFAKGEFFNRHIRGKFRFVRNKDAVREAPSCGRLAGPNGGYT